MDDHEFLCRFESCLLTREEWTHRAHVKTGYLYLSRFPFDEALRRVRTGIRALNTALGTKETLTRGYNETTTRAFLHLIAATMQAYGEAIPASSADSFCDLHPQLLTRHVLRFFYSPRQALNPLSKLEFVEPDLAPLPKIEGDGHVPGPG
jgi:hypothetical protein